MQWLTLITTPSKTIVWIRLPELHVIHETQIGVINTAQVFQKQLSYVVDSPYLSGWIHTIGSNFVKICYRS